MSLSASTYQDYFKKWESEKLGYDQIKEVMTKNGFPSEEIEEVVKLYKKRRLDERTRKGFKLIGLGCVIGFLSCISTVFNIIPAFRDLVFYGLTTIGVLLAMIGAYFVFE